MCKGILVEQQVVSGVTEGRVRLLLESSHRFWAWRVPDVMDQKDRTNPYRQEILN